MRRGFAPHFWHQGDLFAPPPQKKKKKKKKNDQIYHFIKILLGPVLNFERRTPTDLYPECFLFHIYCSSENRLRT